ncbi:hypothetical protein [Nocardiopsis metallicus]|uniref:Uncharacterized protein n=1 Tax=Nocardiopsis metallicus TaxID=179819 RepID=A0A840WMK6_9ACTN|nr:hypothetical protein [Nocardiopsis metallicus]MBB5491348.1 hypothetical protein [Nocardiopsis metallicus]
MADADSELVHRISFELGLGADQLTLLTILLDPTNDPYESATSAQDMLHEFEAFTGDDLLEVHAVAERLRAHQDRAQGRTGALEFEFFCDGEGSINGVNIMTALGSSGTWLAISKDRESLFADRYELPGLPAALKLAENITDEYERLMEIASRIVLTEAPGRPTALSELPDGLYASGEHTWQKTGADWTPVLEPGQSPNDVPAGPDPHGLKRVQWAHSPVNAVADD